MSTQIQHLPSSAHGLKQEAMKAWKMAQNTRAQLKKIKENSSEMVEGVVGAVEVAGTAFAVSYLNGMKGDATGTYKIFGFDSDMFIGGLVLAAGVFELGGKYNEDLYRVGSGALASWATRTGYSKGAAHKTAAATATPPAAAATGGVMPAGAFVGR